LRSRGGMNTAQPGRHERNFENLPQEYREELPKCKGIRSIFLQPCVTDEYKLKLIEVDENGFRHFLYDEHGSSTDRTDLAVKRMRAFYQPEKFRLCCYRAAL